ncbi:MAG: DNA-directed RNA polymerase subunit alpha [bacterium]|nr:DNA-directed RNA polymerase subunit alpha [bacterium]
MQIILLPEPPKIVKKKGNRAQIHITGCSPGYGMTLGNALRRVLLSSLPGAAITGIKIKGVSHEFVAIPGVMEDATILMLNLKQVRFLMHAEEGTFRVTLSKKGKGEVKAGDIQTSSDLEVANPELHLATLTSGDAELEMELEVEKGLGYVPVEEHRREKVEVGLIALDALFSPIKRVNYEVENMRIGDRTDFNRIRFDIETDGTMSPEAAFSRAVEILVEHFERLRELRGADALIDVAGAESSQEGMGPKGETEKLQGVSSSTEEGGIADLKLKTRIAHALETAHLRTIQDITAKTEDELLATEGLGEKAVKEIKKAIGKMGLTLAEKK